MQVEINAFMEKFTVLLSKGLPSPLIINDKLMKHIDYVDKLNKYVSNQNSALGLKALPSGRVLYDNLENLFYIEHEVTHLFTIEPNFFRYTETDETLRKLQRHKIPEHKQWQDMLEIFVIFSWVKRRFQDVFP